jgi:ribosome-binding protein aMBF1 (putative translation factor)
LEVKQISNVAGRVQRTSNPLSPRGVASFSAEGFVDTVAAEGNMGDMILQATSKFRLRLRNEMQLQGVSQRELAKRAGTSYAGINRILQGKQDPTLELADRLADALGMELAKFLEKSSAKRRKTA